MYNILCVYYVYIMCILCIYNYIYTHYVCNSLRKYFINTLCLGDNDQEGTRKYHRLSRFSWLSSWCFLVEIQCLSPKTLRFLEYLQQVANSKPWPSNSSMIYRAQKLWFLYIYSELLNNERVESMQKCHFHVKVAQRHSAAVAAATPTYPHLHSWPIESHRFRRSCCSCSAATTSHCRKALRHARSSWTLGCWSSWRPDFDSNFGCRHGPHCRTQPAEPRESGFAMFYIAESSSQTWLCRDHYKTCQIVAR